MYLGLDLGTSGIKAMLLDDDQNIVASHSAPLTVQRPHSGWSEQDPAEWIVACEAALEGLKASNPKELAATRGIGFSGQMHGATLLDASDNGMNLKHSIRSLKFCCPKIICAFG